MIYLNPLLVFAQKAKPVLELRVRISRTACFESDLHFLQLLVKVLRLLLCYLSEPFFDLDEAQVFRLRLDKQGLPPFGDPLCFCHFVWWDRYTVLLQRAVPFYGVCVGELHVHGKRGDLSDRVEDKLEGVQVLRVSPQVRFQLQK